MDQTSRCSPSLQYESSSLPLFVPPPTSRNVLRSPPPPLMTTGANRCARVAAPSTYFGDSHSHAGCSGHCACKRRRDGWPRGCQTPQGVESRSDAARGSLGTLSAQPRIMHGSVGFRQESIESIEGLFQGGGWGRVSAENAVFFPRAWKFLSRQRVARKENSARPRQFASMVEKSDNAVLSSVLAQEGRACAVVCIPQSCLHKFRARRLSARTSRRVL